MWLLGVSVVDEVYYLRQNPVGYFARSGSLPVHDLGEVEIVSSTSQIVGQRMSFAQLLKDSAEAALGNL